MTSAADHIELYDFFLSACFNSELRHANSWLDTKKYASALTTIMRNRLMHVSTSRDAI